MDTSRSLFVPVPSVVTPQSTSSVGPTLPRSKFTSGNSNNNNNSNPGRGNRVKETFINLYNNTPQSVKDEMVRVVIDRVANRGSNNGGGKNSGRKHSSGYSLSPAPNPKITSLDTGITPNAYTNDELKAKENHCAPLHMTKSVFNILGGEISTYFKNIIAFDLQTKAQANIGFNLKVETDFSADKIYVAVNDLIYALQVYFYATSIISYHSDPTNKNEGMIYLRKQMGPETIEKILQLNRRLSDTPCPPRLLEFIRYMCNTYYTGDNQGSPLVKIAPVYDFTNAALLSAINDSISRLANAQNSVIYTLLRRAIPQWRPAVLYDVEPIPTYDSNFLTIFANLPFVAHDGTTFKNFPSAATFTEDISYNSYTNELDGAAYAMTSILVDGSGDFFPGFYNPPSTTLTSEKSSRYSFYKIGSTIGFYVATNNSFLSRSRPETYQTSDNGVTLDSLHLAGTDKCIGVSANTITDTAKLVLDHLMSADTIKSESRNSGFNNKSRRKGGSKGK